MNHWYYLDLLLRRLACTESAKLSIPFSELSSIPISFMQFLEQQELLKQTKNIRSVVCVGCEEGCIEEVSFYPNSQQAYIDCQNNEHIGRVAIDSEQLLQWELSLSSLARKIGILCGFNGQERVINQNQWLIGILDGKKHHAELILQLTPEYGGQLSVNGYLIALSEILIISDHAMQLDLIRLQQLADKPKQLSSSKTVKREAGKLKTEARNHVWREEAKKIKKKSPKLSLNQIAERIVNANLGEGASVSTIVRQLRNL